MGLWQSFKKWISGDERSMSGGSLKSPSSGGKGYQRSYSSTTYTSRRDGGTGSGSYERYESRRQQKEKAEREKKKRKKQQERLEAYKPKEITYKSMAEAVKNSLSDVNNSMSDAIAKATTTDIKQQKIGEARLARIKEQKAFNEATKHRYDVKGAKTKAERLKRRQNVKSQTYDKDTALAEEKHELKYHKKAYSAARGATSGATFGASDLLARKGRKGEAKKAEEYYQKNKSKGAETAGEIGASLASFMLTGGASKAAVGKLAPKALKEGSEKFAVKLARNKLIRKAAEKEVANAVKKGLVKEGSKEVLERAAKNKAKDIVANLAEDAAVNLTTGGLMDFNKATAEHKIGSKDWWKEMGTSAAMNVGLGTAATVGLPAAGKGIKRAIGGVTKETDDAIKAVAREGLASRIARRAGAVSFKPPTVRTKNSVKNATGVDISKPMTDADYSTLRTVRDNLADSLSKTEAGTAEAKTLTQKVKNIDRVLKRTETVTSTADDVVADVAKTADNVVGTVDSQVDNVSKGTSVKDTKSKAVNNIDDAVRENEQITIDEIAKENAEPEKIASGKKEPPKSKAQKAKERTAEKLELEELARRQRKGIDSEVRYATGGEYGYRQGEATASQYGSIDESKRITESQRKIKDALKRDGAFKSDEFGIFKTANRETRDKIASDAYNRVSKDPQAVMDRLRELDTRLRGELKSKSALESAEHISIDDIADITALRNLFEENGLKVPKEYDETFSNIIAWQKTENAQGLVATDLFLKENSPEYRRSLLNRDLNSFMRKVIGADDAAIADIKRSLDENFGEGYFDKAIEELANTKRKWGEAEFREAYKELQAQIFMNSKPSVWDTVNLFRHSFMLSSLKTGGNNIIGNVMMRMMYNVSDLMQVGMENALAASGKDFRRTTAILKNQDQRRLAKMITSGSLGAHNIKNAKYLEGFADQKFANLINDWANMDVAEMMASSKYMGDIVKGVQYKPTTAGGQLKQGFVKLGGIGNKAVSYMLNEPDSWFVERNYRSALLKYLEANGVNSFDSLENVSESLLKDARAHAKDVALENTYKKANRVVSFLEGLRQKGYKKGSSPANKVATIMLDAELPYLKVPANLVVNNFRYSPLGAAKGAIDAAIAVGKGDTNALNAAVREMSKGLTGTGMFYLGYMMFCDDQMADDSWGFIGNAKDELKEYGVRDNSLKVGNHNFNLANMGIGSVQFLMGAALAEDFQEAGRVPTYQAVLDAAGKTLDVTADMSLLENATALMDAFGNGGDYNMTLSDRFGNAGQKIASDYAAQFIANPVRGVAKGMTSADLDTGVRKGDTTKVQRNIERGVNNFVQGIPVLNEKVLAHKVDTHGNLINERKTTGDKAKQVAINVMHPLSPNKVHIPEADKEELRVKKTNKKGEEVGSFKPYGFDKDRKFEAVVGQTGKSSEVVPLDRKTREQVARSAKHSGYDGALNVVQKGMFGDRLGERAQYILNNIPDDEEKAREFIFATPEWKGADNATKEKWLNAWYGQGAGNRSKGVSRTRNAEAFINVAGNSEGDFKWQNDLTEKQQEKYTENNLADYGIDKGMYADAIQAMKDGNHKWDEETLQNKDTINSAKKTKLALLGMENLTPEQRVAIYNVIKGKRYGYGWTDWDGISGGSGYRRRGYRRRGYRRYGRGRSSGSGVVSTANVDPKAYKSKNVKFESMAKSLPKVDTSTGKQKAFKAKKSLTTKSHLKTAKITPPKVKMKKYEV